MLALVYLHKKIPAESGFWLMKWELTDKQGEEARIIHNGSALEALVRTHVLLNVDTYGCI